ncbi:MAG: ABC transporter [Actinobacteria bacterium]|nr:MAG: ABC transporter [Actinomycetota bacterium]RIK02663.1 MAG: ABC transporter [Acidobacteriota bacterium]
MPQVQRSGSVAAFRALLLRDVTVLRKNLAEFIPRTLLQPLLLVFVFTYVLPKIQLAPGGEAGAETFSTLLIAGVVGTAILFQGIQSVALPLVQEFGFTREIEDRVLAPLRVELVAVEKIVSGALQCLLSAALVFPIAAVVPVTPVHLRVDWPVLITLALLACVASASLGLFFGTVFEPRTVPMLFGVIVVPITFLGCVYYSWKSLAVIPWLQVVVLANPLVYICEGFRAALTPAEHMPLWVIYPVLVGFTGVFASLGIRSFKRRVIA